MRILVLGGTKFLGKHFVIAARDAGHELTLFNRGETNPGLFPDLDTVHGDRDGDLGKLGDRRWDAVFDPSGYLPRIVGANAAWLTDRVDHYTFISTVSVYKDFSGKGNDESSPVGALDDPTVETIEGETYGPLKALCEQAVLETFPGRSLVVRPGLIVGPDDPSNRFTYWVTRLAKGGETLVPLPKDSVKQIIDVRDLATWTLRLMEAQATGVLNATGPREPIPMHDLLDRMGVALNSDVQWTWVESQFLLDEEIAPWMGLPLWLPGEEYQGLERTSIAKALASGLTFRPVEDTARDTLRWIESLDGDPPGEAGLDPKRERELLDAWRARTGQ